MPDDQQPYPNFADTLRAMRKVMTNHQLGRCHVPEGFVPPGQHPMDQANSIDNPVDFQLDRLSTYVLWSSEHLASFEKLRDIRPDEAESELRNLDNAVRHAVQHLRRLEELLRHGYQATSSPSGDYRV